MLSAEDLHRILDRIATGSYTDADIADLRRALSVSGQTSLQLGKYNVHVTEGKDIQIGDRIYQGIDADTIREFISEVLSAVASKRSGAPEPAWPQVRAWYLERLEYHFKHWSEKYTDLRLTTDIRVATYKGQRLKRTHEKGKWWFHEALTRRDEDGQLLANCFMILGDPGGGKTTACQRSAWEFAKEGLITANGQANPRVPIYLELSGYRKNLPLISDLVPYQRVLALLAQEMKRLLAIHSVETSLQNLEEYVKSSPFIFFFDGLNEVGVEHRESLIADVLSFIDTFSGHNHQFVITTRKFDYEYDLAPFFPTEQFHTLEILELDSAGMNEFIMRDLGRISEVYRAVEHLPDSPRKRGVADLDRLKKGEYDPQEEDVLEPIKKLLRRVNRRLNLEADDLVADLEGAQELVKILRQPDHSRVLWLAQNPSTLKDIVDVYRAEQKIPHSRIRLFERAIQARLDAQAAKLGHQRSRFPQELKFEALQKIALHMIEPGEGLRIDEARALPVIKDVLEQHHSKASPEELLVECVFHDALLVEKAFGTYSFVKQPYQEYFVARELRGRWLSAVKSGKYPLKDKYLGRVFQNRYYFQVVSSMAGLLTSEEVYGLLQRLRKRKITQRLAALCIRNAEELPGKAVDEYVDWTRHHILRFSMLPEGIVNALLVAFTAVTLAFFFNLDTRALFPPISLSLSQLIAALPLAGWHHLFFSAFIITTAVASMSIMRQSFQLTLRPKQARTSDIGPALTMLIIAANVAVMAGLASDNLAAALIAFSGCLWLFLMMRTVVAAASPAARWMTTRIEEYVVNRHLIHYLEVLRDMGPNATSTINEIQYSLAKNQFMSERVKDAIQRTWAVSPRTVLQVLDELNVPSRQAEAIKVLESAVLHVSTSSTLREKAVAALFQIANSPSNVAVMLGVVDVLGKLALEQPDYREQVVGLLRQVLTKTENQISVRQRAWRNLYDLGLPDVQWPRATIKDMSLTQLVIIGLVVAGLCILLRMVLR